MQSPTERFVVLCGTSIEPWIACDELGKMDWNETVSRIASGDVTGMSRVIGVDVDQGKSRDVTDLVAKCVANIWAMREEPITDKQHEFIELHLGVSAANKFQREFA